jgi:hypothetical protein
MAAVGVCVRVVSSANTHSRAYPLAAASTRGGLDSFSSACRGSLAYVTNKRRTE